MRCFVAEAGKIDILNCEHSMYAKTVHRMSLARLLTLTVRVKIHNRFLAFETSKTSLTDGQKRAINKLYKIGECLGYTGKIGDITITTDSREYIRRVKFAEFDN